MDPRRHELASALCKLAGAPDLLAWLELGDGCSADEALGRLRERRRWLQSMQSNPKFRDEALFVIKHMSALEAVLADPSAHRRAVREQREADRLPVLEMAIDSVLAGGELTAEQEEFLGRSAIELGVSTERYERLLRDRAAAAGVPLPDERGVSFRGQGWWDEGFARLLVQTVPPGTSTLVDVACGPGWSAATIVPERPGLRWIGYEASESRAEVTGRTLAPFGSRVEVRSGTPEALDLRDRSAEVVLAVMAWHDRPEPERALAEAGRVARRRIVAVEPDELGHRFYFGGNLEELNRAVQRLRIRAAGEAGVTLGLGPRLAGLFDAAGLEPVRTTVHPVQGAQPEPVERFATRVRALVAGIGRVLPEDAPEISAVEQALSRLEQAAGPGRVALGCHVLPVFVCVAVR